MTQPYIINLIDRDNLESGTVDILNYLSLEGFIRYLEEIQGYFSNLNLPYKFSEPQLYYIVQDDFEAIKVGLAKSPRKRLQVLQTGNPHKLSILFFYDPVKYEERFKGFFNRDDLTCYEHEHKELRWLSNPINGNGVDWNGEWFKPNDRSFRILIRHGLYLLNWYKNER